MPQEKTRGRSDVDSELLIDRKGNIADRLHRARFVNIVVLLCVGLIGVARYADTQVSPTRARSNDAASVAARYR